MKIFNFKEKKKLPLTNKEYISYHNQENFTFAEIMNCKVRDHCHYIGKYRGLTQSKYNSNNGNLKIFLWFFTMDQILIVMLSKKIQSKSLKEAEGVYKIKCKYGNDDKKSEERRNKHNNCKLIFNM